MNIDGHVLVYSFLLLFSLFSRLSQRERITSRNKNICGQRYVNMAVQEDAKTQTVGLFEPIFFSK